MCVYTHMCTCVLTVPVPVLTEARGELHVVWSHPLWVLRPLGEQQDILTPELSRSPESVFLEDFVGEVFYSCSRVTLQVR